MKTFWNNLIVSHWKTVTHARHHAVVFLFSYQIVYIGQKHGTSLYRVKELTAGFLDFKMIPVCMNTPLISLKTGYHFHAALVFSPLGSVLFFSVSAMRDGFLLIGLRPSVVPFSRCILGFYYRVSKLNIKH